MAAKRGPRYSKKEFATRGEALYDEKVRPHLKKKDHGKFAAIDIETGEYEIAKDLLTACHRLEARIPDPQTWAVRIGSRYLFSFGGHGLGGEE